MDKRHALVVGPLQSSASDTTAPTVAITCAQTSPTTVTPLNFTFTLSEIATDFAIGDITVGNGTASNFAGSGTSYTCDVTPTANGTVTIDVAANAFHDAAGNGNTAATRFSIVYIAFVLRDDFTDTAAAGAVNGTNATPTGGTRTATDTNSKMSVGSGVLSIATGGAGYSDPGLWYSSFVRGAGKFVVGHIKITSLGSDWLPFGVDSNTSSTLTTGFYLNNTGGGTIQIWDNGGNVIFGNYATATDYYLAVVLRANGAFFFVKGGVWTNWTLVFFTVAGNTTPLYPTIAGKTLAVFTSDFIRLPVDTFTMTPIASDAFTRADGSLGNTGGGGSAESGGSGLAWTAQAGTWGIATNKAVCSAATGIATVNASKADVMMESVITRSAGSMGLVARYTDANNYIYASYDGTNWTVIEVVAGTPNTILAATAATYGATKITRLSLRGTKVRLYYGEAGIGGELTTAITTGNNHGLYTTDTGATFDNFVVWSKGNNGEYAALDNYINP